MRTGRVFVDGVTVKDRLRPVDSAKVAALAESMAEIGLQQPITVWSPDVDTVDLVAGLHRLRAAEKLGWGEIECVFIELDDLDRELWEIDENLCRAELTEGERAQHTAKRAEIAKQKSELDKLAKTKSAPNKNADKGQTGVVAEISKATGKSEKSVRRDKARGEKIAPDVWKEIQGTAIEDSGVQLDALTGVSHEKQREAVKQVNLGHHKDVRDFLDGKPDTREKEFESLKRAWLKASGDARDKFWEWLDPMHIPQKLRVIDGGRT